MNTKHKKKIPCQLEVTHYFLRMGFQIKYADAFFLVLPIGKLAVVTG